MMVFDFNLSHMTRSQGDQGALAWVMRATPDKSLINREALYSVLFEDKKDYVLVTATDARRMHQARFDREWILAQGIPLATPERCGLEIVRRTKSSVKLGEDSPYMFPATDKVLDRALNRCTVKIQLPADMIREFVVSDVLGAIQDAGYRVPSLNSRLIEELCTDQWVPTELRIDPSTTDAPLLFRQPGDAHDRYAVIMPGSRKENS